MSKSPYDGMPTGQTKAALRQRGISASDLARAVGVIPDTMFRTLRGEQAGSIELWNRITEELGRPDLMEIVLKNFERTCRVCMATYYDYVIRRVGSKRERMTCSKVCGDTWAKRAKRTANERASGRDLTMMRRKVERYDAAVVAFCRSCEPLGVCRNEDCELRTISPLPFIPIAGLKRPA